MVFDHNGIFPWFVAMTLSSHFTVIQVHGVCDVKLMMRVPQIYQVASLGFSVGICRMVYRRQWWEVVLGLS